MDDSEARAALIAAHRPALDRLLTDAARATPGEALVAVVLVPAEPLGYLIAAALQQRWPGLQPDAAVRDAVSRGISRAPVLVGVLPQRTVGETLDGLAPRLQPIATELQAPSSRRDAVALVAIAGGAELLPLGADSGRT